MSPPSRDKTGNTHADDQQTMMIEVHVETPRSWTRFRQSRPNTTRMLEQKGSRR
jgi:hypothetical protein